LLPGSQRRREDTARAAAIETLTKEGQEVHLAALGLVLDTLILWNTRDPQRARDAERAAGGEAPPKTSRGSPRWASTLARSSDTASAPKFLPLRGAPVSEA